MRKVISIVLSVVLCAGLLMMTGCSSDKEIESPYAAYDLSEYITLPDYDVYTTSEPDVVISDEDIDAEIQTRLAAAVTTEEVTEGTVEEGDTVTISYEGTLADGTTEDGMSSDSYTLTLGSANMIEGFQEGLYGATIGEAVTLDLQFPDPYTTNEDLSGKDVTFVVTVLSKSVEVTPELDEDSIKSDCDDSSVKTEEDYRAYIKTILEEEEYESQLSDLKQEIYNQIIDDTEVLQYPEDELNAEIEEMTLQYQSYAESYGYDDFATFLDEYFGMDEDEFNEQVTLYAQSILMQEMVIYAIADKEGITITEKEYSDYLADLLEEAGFADEDEFSSYAGMTIEEYAEAYKMDRDLILTKELDLLYDRLEKE